MIRLQDLQEFVDPPRFCRLYESQQLAAVASALSKHVANHVFGGEAKQDAFYVGQQQPKQHGTLRPGSVQVAAAAEQHHSSAPSQLAAASSMYNSATELQKEHQQTEHFQQVQSAKNPLVPVSCLQAVVLPSAHCSDQLEDTSSSFSQASSYHNTANLHMHTLGCTHVAESATEQLAAGCGNAGIHTCQAGADLHPAGEVLLLLNAFGTQLEALPTVAPATTSSSEGELAVVQAASPDLLMFFLETAADVLRHKAHAV